MKLAFLHRFFLFIVLLFIAKSASSQTVHSPLRWKIAPRQEVSKGGESISLAGFNAGKWVKATVPGTVFYDHVAAGKEPNPDYADNIYKVDKARYDRPFWYRTEFSSAGVNPGETVWLNFKGVNKWAEIFVNGKHIGTLSGLMAHGKFDITRLITGRRVNAVAVQVTPPRYFKGHGLANFEAPTYLSSASWDWMPAVPGFNSGISGEVSITTSGPVSVEDPWIRTDLPDLEHARLSLSVKLRNTSGKMVTGVLKARISPGNVTVTTSPLSLRPGMDTMLTYDSRQYKQLLINHPKLWWPNGYGGKADGTQELYNCKVIFEADNKVSDVVTKTFGVRKVSSDTTSLNGPLRVYINNVPVLLKGGNWGMSDYMLKVHTKDYEPRVRFHQEMNFNVIRNWTGEVTDEAFYDYCDKYGIMIWDDFWLNNFGPIDSLNIFKANAIEKVKRLRHHPSVVIWCGANEGVPGGDPKGPLNIAIRNAVKDNDGDDRIYLARSNAGETNPNFSIHGGSHNLSGSGIWGNLDPKTYFTDPKNGYLFSQGSYGMRSELGTATFVNIESFKRFMPQAYWIAPTVKDVESTTNMWARHYFSTNGDLGGGAQPATYIRDINARYGEATSLADFCKKAQLMNVETMKAMFESWNDHMWNDATGMLIWMSQSAYPSMIWQTYDYYLDLTGAYFGARSACEPVHIQWNAATNSVKVINNKPYALDKLTAEAVIYNGDGRAARVPQTAALNVGPSMAKEAFVLDQHPSGSKLTDVYFLKLKLKDRAGNVLSENFYWLGKTYLDYKALSKLAPIGKALVAGKAEVTTAANGVNKVLIYIISNISDNTVAFGVRAQLLDNKGRQILPAIISDSYFSLMEGESKKLTVEIAPDQLAQGYNLDLRAYNE